MGIPKEIAVDTADSPHLPDLGSQTDDFGSHMGARLNHPVGVVGELRGCRRRVPLDFIGHQLLGALAILLLQLRVGSNTCDETNKLNGPALAKKPC